MSTDPKVFRIGSRTKTITLPRYTSDRNSPERALANRLENSTLTEGQKEAVKTSLTGRGRITGVQGFAGTGKTFMLEKMAAEAERAGYTVEGLAPSRQAVAQLKDALPSSETLQARLLRGSSKDGNASPDKTILVVDEASMVSTKQMLGLLEQAQQQKIARVILVGDVQQLDAVAAGTPFALLQKVGMRTAVMSDIQRQRNSKALGIVNNTIARDVQGAFAKLKGGIHADHDVARRGAELYVEAQRDTGTDTGLVTPSNKTRRALNSEIRTLLKEEGKIGSQDVSLKALEPLRFSRAELSDPLSFTPGDIVLAHQSVASQKLSKGHTYQVINTDQHQGLTLRDRETGKTTTIHFGQNTKVAGSIEVFEETQRSFSAGDQVKFRITDPVNAISNGDAGQVVSIGESKIKIELKDGAVTTLPKESLAAAGIDHAYALTGHDYQGVTVDRIIVAMTANEKMADQKSFYVGVSRARDQIELVTDKPEELAEKLERQTGEKVNAIEAYLDKAKERAAAERSEEDADQQKTHDHDGPLVEKVEERKQLEEELRAAVQKQKGDVER